MKSLKMQTFWRFLNGRPFFCAVIECSLDVLTQVAAVCSILVSCPLEGAGTVRTDIQLLLARSKVFLTILQGRTCWPDSCLNCTRSNIGHNSILQRGDHSWQTKRDGVLHYTRRKRSGTCQNLYYAIMVARYRWPVAATSEWYTPDT